VSVEPGEAILQENTETGEITVMRADPVIRVAAELLDMLVEEAWDGQTLTLDTAGEYRYRQIGPDPSNAEVWLFGRVGERG
jgi:hypothetical protein